MNSLTSLHVLDGQKLIRAYVYCYVLSRRLKINFLILSYSYFILVYKGSLIRVQEPEMAHTTSLL